MAALTVDPTLVFPGTNATQFQLPAAVAITAGQALYRTAANTLGLADANGVSPANTFAGFALNNAAAAGQPVQCTGLAAAYQHGVATGVNSGDNIWLSPTPGGITKTFADLVTGCTVILLGVALGTTGQTNVTTMALNPTTGGIV